MYYEHTYLIYIHQRYIHGFNYIHSHRILIMTVPTHLHTCIHTHTHIHTHIYIHTYIHTLTCRSEPILKMAEQAPKTASRRNVDKVTAANLCIYIYIYI
jgi:hypothetical protein